MGEAKFKVPDARDNFKVHYFVTLLAAILYHRDHMTGILMQEGDGWKWIVEKDGRVPEEYVKAAGLQIEDLRRA